MPSRTSSGITPRTSSLLPEAPPPERHHSSDGAVCYALAKSLENMLLLMTIFNLPGTDTVTSKVMAAMDRVVNRIPMAKVRTVSGRDYGQW